MQAEDLEVFHMMPFYFWVKDDQGTYLWANGALTDAAGEAVVGKTDSELPWAESAEALRAADKQVLETGKDLHLKEAAFTFGGEPVTLNLCKFVREFEGARCAFGISFILD